jgi:proline dehydrogenase
LWSAGVTLMVDAEQTYLQPAIDHSVQYLQRRYNQERAVVYNTIQCYLMDS